MTDISPTLPEFANPPVVETVLGVQFAPLQTFSVAHFGLFWSQIRNEYPNASLQGPLAPVIENFEAKARSLSRVDVEMISEPELRFWYIDSTGNHLIQVQKDRFHLNWKKVTGTESYPHYSSIKPKFEEEWIRFTRFLTEENAGKIDITQCELTYVNHIEIGKGWNKHADLYRVSSLLGKPPEGLFLPPLEAMSLKTSFVMPEKKGRLHLILQPAIRREDSKEVLQMNLIARGRPGSTDTRGILEWLDLGHEWIVRGFAELTTNEMHKIWGRIQ